MTGIAIQAFAWRQRAVHKNIIGGKVFSEFSM
jgi:hypothetical protein